MKETLSKIEGTYWLAADKDGSRCICQGNKPLPFGLGWVLRKPKMGWISLDNDVHPLTPKDDDVVSSEDYKDLQFPKVTFKDGPIEILISKTGKVYTIDDKSEKQ